MVSSTFLGSSGSLSGIILSNQLETNKTALRKSYKVLALFTHLDFVTPISPIILRFGLGRAQWRRPQGIYLGTLPK